MKSGVQSLEFYITGVETMQRWIKVEARWDDGRLADEDEDLNAEFDLRCSCAVACGYRPCGNGIAGTASTSGDGSGKLGAKDDDAIEGSLDISLESGTPSWAMYQMFYDPEGKASHICGHCSECENCQLVPESDVYCEKFRDNCYAEEE